METTTAYLGYVGIMEKKMEATTGNWGYVGDNGKDNGNCETKAVCWVIRKR